MSDEPVDWFARYMELLSKAGQLRSQLAFIEGYTDSLVRTEYADKDDLIAIRDRCQAILERIQL